MRDYLVKTVLSLSTYTRNFDGDKNPKEESFEHENCRNR